MNDGVQLLLQALFQLSIQAIGLKICCILFVNLGP